MLGVYPVRAYKQGGVMRIIVTAMLALLVWAGPSSARTPDQPDYKKIEKLLSGKPARVLVVFMGAKGHPPVIREGAPAQAPK